MLGRAPSLPFVCARCLRNIRRNNDDFNQSLRRSFAASVRSPLSQSVPFQDEQEKEPGAMSRRLADMSERSLEEGGRGAQKAVEEAGFDEELKAKLLDRIAGANFKAENPQAFAQANLPSSAGRGTRDIASAAPWIGNESVEDAALRMLDSSYKRMRVPSRIPSPATPPKKVDTGRPKKAASSGVRLANARDKSSMYNYMNDSSMTKEEREEYRKQLKERFQPGARATPITLSGLASLANERIEDAIARGQFKNLPRGKKIERDYNMSSPFLDTTEYFMNKIIQKQDIVPPWIEKQQELVATAAKFRSRLRADWRRHVARVIASRGGSLQSQLARAEEYARAEHIVNPSKKKVENLNAVDGSGHVSQISLSGELQPVTDDEPKPTVEISVSEELLPQAPDPAVTAVDALAEETRAQAAAEKRLSDDPRVIDGAVFPFRDAAWEETERSYHKVVIDSLNTLTRSYNLMAPDLAKKPYFSLERELRSCFADVAPQLKDEILQRARTPKVKIKAVKHHESGVLDLLGGGTAKVYDETRPQYGFKQFWKDVFGKKEAA